jgi:hypothetical protein
MPSVAPWTCDTCKMPIQKRLHGVVEWVQRETGKKRFVSHGLHLVHRKVDSPRKTKRGCEYDEDKWLQKDDSLVINEPLKKFLRADGLMALLELTARGEFESHDGIIEMIKRLHIPGYEQARNGFRAAIGAGVFENDTTPSFYDQKQINATLSWIAKRKETP